MSAEPRSNEGGADVYKRQVYEGEIIDGVDAERMLDYIRFWQTDEAQKL